MMCIKCKNEFPSECTCTDRDHRLEQLAGHERLAFRWCKICNKHADICECADGPTSTLKIGSTFRELPEDELPENKPSDGDKK